MLLSSVEDDEVELPPMVVIDHAESDSELTALLSRAVGGIGLEWNPPPFPKLAVG